MNVCCIKCGVSGEETTIGVDVTNGEIYCGECEGTYTVADVEEFIGEWSKLLPWLKGHPALVEAAATV